MTTFLQNVSYTIRLSVVLGLFFVGGISAHAYPVEKIPGGDEVFGDFVVGPTKTDITLSPGSEQVVELMVTNRMGERRLFTLSAEDMKGSDDPGQAVVLLGDDRGPYSLKDYLHMPEMSFELGQGERARIPVTIKVPSDAQPGGLYGSVLVTTASLPKAGDEAVKAGAKSGSVIVSRIGALFFITVPGSVEKEGKVQSFKTIPDGRKYFTEGPIHFQILFENTGSVHLNPSAIISIKNILGEEVGQVVTDPWFAFPQSVRMREVVWEAKHLFGYYTAEARINRGYDGEVDVATVSFYVIPWKLIALGLAGLIAVFFVLRMIFRTFEIKKKSS